MEEKILEFIKQEFGDNIPKELRKAHYSYCLFPEEECTCNDLDVITPETSLISGGYIDSFSMIRTLRYLEITFNIKIADKDSIPENFNTVNKMIILVKKYLEKQK